jgi:hypothetical protein
LFSLPGAGVRGWVVKYVDQYLSHGYESRVQIPNCRVPEFGVRYSPRVNQYLGIASHVSHSRVPGFGGQ